MEISEKMLQACQLAKLYCFAANIDRPYDMAMSNLVIAGNTFALVYDEAFGSWDIYQSLEEIITEVTGPLFDGQIWYDRTIFKEIKPEGEWLPFVEHALQRLDGAMRERLLSLL